MARRRLIAVLSVLGSCIGALTLSTTEQKSVVIGPGSSYAFGNVPLNSSATTNPNPYFTISPQSSTDDDCVTLNLAGGCGSDFMLLGPATPARVYCMPIQIASAQPPGAMPCTPVTYQFGATFSPHIITPQSCDVLIKVVPSVSGLCTAGGGSGTLSTVTLTGTGAGSSYSISVDKTMLNFGDVNTTSDSTPQTVTVTNTGTSSVTVDIGDTDPLFPYAPNSPSTVLGVGSNALFAVHCHQPSAGPHSGAITFTPVEGGSPKAVALACNGIVTTVNVAPNPIDFGGLLVGHAPLDVAVTISSSAAVPVSNFAFQNASPDISFLGGTPPATTVTSVMPDVVTVHYSAMTPDDSNNLGTMTFDAGGTTIHVPITGTLETGSIGMNPANVDFGPICAGSNASQDVDVYANAEGTVTLSAPTAPAAPFSVTMSPTAPTDTTQHVVLSTSVQPPAGGTTGDVTGTIDVNTNIPGMATYEVDLHAVVLAAGTSPTPDILHFGTVPTGTPTSGKDIQITNCSGGDLSLAGFAFAGDTPDEFKLVTPTNFPIALAATKSQAFTIQMFPLTVGPKDATFNIDFGTGSATATVDGQAVNGTSAGTTDRETYYACSTGRSTAVWPIGLALLALRRRRR